jgi:hypothetical protein
MQVIHKLKMDLLRQNNTQIIDAVQLDSNTRKLELSLYEGAMPWAVPDGVLVAIAYRCEDGTRGVYDTLPDDSTAYEIDGNKITITIIPDALAVVGETKMTIIVSSSESKEDSLATFPVTFRVAENYSVEAKDPEGYVNLRGWLESEIDKILESSSIKFSAIKRVNREYETNDYLLSLTYHTKGSDVQNKAKMLMYLSANGVDFRKVAAMPIDFDKKIYDLSTIYFNDMWVIAFDCVDYEYNEWTQENSTYNRGGNRVGIITTTDFIEFKKVYVELPQEWKSTWAPELFVVDGKLHMIITTSTCTVTRDTASGGKTYVKDGIYICRLNDDFTLESYQQITLPDDGIAPDNYIDGFIYQSDGVYYLGIKEETNKKQRIYQSSDLYGDYTLVHEFEEQVEGLAIVKFNDRYFAYSDKYASGGFYQDKGTAISVSSDLQTWSGHAMANVDGDAWNRHFTPFVVSTPEQKQSIDNFLRSFGPVDAPLDTWSKKSYCVAAGTGKYTIERLLIQPNAVYYISGGADLTINFVDTSLMNHGDTCKFIIASMASNAKITFKYNEGNTLFWDNLEDLVFAKSNGVLTVTCGNGVANKYCFAEVSASSGTDYILPVATPNRLGGVKPVAKTEDMTEPVGVDENGGLWATPGGAIQPLTFTGTVEATYDGTEPVEIPIPSGGGSGWKLRKYLKTTEQVSSISIPFGLSNPYASYKIFICIPRNNTGVNVQEVVRVGLRNVRGVVSGKAMSNNSNNATIVCHIDSCGVRSSIYAVFSGAGLIVPSGVAGTVSFGIEPNVALTIDAPADATEGFPVGVKVYIWAMELEVDA